jgi:3'-phosphoadenosine 5'-phosphosulfate sulfotransferase (PAPS reductase)/FAD synthetase
MDEDVDPVVAVGIRASESAARANLFEWEFNKEYDCDVWRPLIRWTEQDVIESHGRHCVYPNPLYLRGASRVGCWPCIFSRKQEIEFLANNDPSTIDRIRNMEARMTELSRANYAARGEDIQFVRTWFQGRAEKETWDIDTVVRWSRTSHGGKQFELFAPDTEPGCVRWGLCESMQKDDAP